MRMGPRIGYPPRRGAGVSQGNASGQYETADRKLFCRIYRGYVISVKDQCQKVLEGPTLVLHRRVAGGT